MQKINLCYRESNDYHGQVIDHFVTEIPKQKAKIVSVPQEGSDESLAISTNGILWSFKSFFKNAFLPQNFPHSVSEDYLDYQLWDSIQAFASSISGSLATQAVLKGVGVGDEDASPLAATITWLLRHGSGMIGSILFTWMQSSDLDHNCKKWRLFADFANDFAMCLELSISGAFWPSESIQVVLCSASIARALVGVAGGATRTAITQHQARADNISDVAAKDGSQETLVNLAALLVNLTILPLVSDDQNLIWILFLTMTCFHLWTNYLAVTALIFETFNHDRLTIALEHYFRNKAVVLPPRKVNEEESPFWKWKSSKSKSIILGAPFSTIQHEDFEQVKKSLERKNYFVSCSNEGMINLVLTTQCRPDQVFRAYCEAISYDEKNFDFEDFATKAQNQGWKTTHLQANCQGWRGDLMMM